MSLASETPPSTSEPAPDSGAAENLELYQDLLSVTSHDLRSPLGAIGIFCELLLTGDAPLDESQKKSVEMIAEATGKAQRILEDVSEIGRIYRGAVTLTLEPDDLREVFVQAAAQAAPAAQARNVVLSVELPSVPLQALTDPRVEQIAARMIGDAAAWGANGSRVTVTGAASAGGGPVSVTVRAAGEPRLPDRRLPEPPTSLRGRLANRKPGESRYSVHIAQRLAALMGGRLDYASDGPFEATLSLRSA